MSTAELVEFVLNAMFSGISLSQALKAQQAKGRYREFFEYLDSSPELSNKYARAEEAYAEHLVSETVDIADDEAIDAQRARNRIDARKFVASKLKPKKFGERIDVNVHETIDIRAAMLEGRQRALRPIDDLRVARDVKVIDSTNDSPHLLTGRKPVVRTKHAETKNADTSNEEDIYS